LDNRGSLLPTEITLGNELQVRVEQRIFFLITCARIDTTPNLRDFARIWLHFLGAWKPGRYNFYGLVTI
jgi:hypothetical protein